MYDNLKGIGYETAEDFAKRGARVILACRNEEKGLEAQRKIREATDNQEVVFKKLNLTSLRSVREFANEINSTEPRYLFDLVSIQIFRIWD